MRSIHLISYYPLFPLHDRPDETTYRLRIFGLQTYAEFERRTGFTGKRHGIPQRFGVTGYACGCVVRLRHVRTVGWLSIC